MRTVYTVNQKDTHAISPQIPTLLVSPLMTEWQTPPNPAPTSGGRQQKRLHEDWENRFLAVSSVWMYTGWKMVRLAATLFLGQFVVRMEWVGRAGRERKGLLPWWRPMCYCKASRAAPQHQNSSLSLHPIRAKVTAQDIYTSDFTFSLGCGLLVTRVAWRQGILALTTA